MCVVYIITLIFIESDILVNICNVNLSIAPPPKKKMSFNWILSEIVLSFSVVKTEHAVCPKIFPMPHIKHSIITIKHAIQLVSISE